MRSIGILLAYAIFAACILLFAISVTRFLNGTMTSLAFAETPEAFHRGQGFCHSAQDPFICRFVRTLF